MQVFKFGGASVKNADGVRNLVKIVSQYGSRPLLVVVSAMDKTTNALEKVAEAWFYKQGDSKVLLEEVKRFHVSIIHDLFGVEGSAAIASEIDDCFAAVEWDLDDEPVKSYDFHYDQLVSLGELVSTKIVAAYMQQYIPEACWLEARDYIKTDDTWREGRILWPETTRLVQDKLVPFFEQNPKSVAITQGFTGETSENFTTTLGREGSDYTASVFAHCLNAESVTIWKDVPGVLNADPKFFSGTVMLNQISFEDAIELAYYGAGVIHPKTIQPIKNKNIPLYVKSFLQPQNTGTIISNEQNPLPVPSFIVKKNQVLISITSRDFSFIMEDHLADIFRLLAEAGIKLNFMQNSAVSFSLCINADKFKVPALEQELSKTYNVQVKPNVEIITIRYFNQSTIDRLSKDKQILLEVIAGETVQLVTC